MKFKQQTRKNTWACLLPTALIFSLVACDDVTSLPGSNTTTVPQSDPIILPSGAATGVLLGNTPISGVSFTASSGTSGVTDEAGNFNFSYGDTIEFKIGKLSLGNVAAV
ncbi:MAG: adhesin, partial [Nitrosomonas sp.]|nr:adhesin [Nitrosomonas sp.]